MNGTELLGKITGFLADGVHERLYPQFRPWASRFLPAAASKWGMHMLGQVRCQHRYGNHRQCTQASVSACKICGAPVCMMHGSMHVSADVVCDGCVAAAARDFAYRQAADGFASSWRRREHPPEPPPPGEEPSDPKELYLGILGLDGRASWQDVHQRYRKLGAELHPDRFPEGPERASAERRFARVTTAYNELRRYYREAA